MGQDAMTPRFDLTVPGKAIPQGSMKGYVRVGKAGVPVAGITSDDPELIQWRMKVTGYAIEKQAEYMHTNPALVLPLTGPVGIRIIFTAERPQQHFHPVNSKRTVRELKADAPRSPPKRPTSTSWSGRSSMP